MKLLTTYIFEQVKANRLSEAEAKKLLQEIASAQKKVSDNDQPIAIVGVACRMPEADDPAGFWQNLRSGVDSVRQIPAERQTELEKMIRVFYGTDLGEIEYNEAAYLERIDLFDPAFFNIPPGEAKVMCPEQRLFLEVAYEAFEDAGYAERDLYGSKTGIYAGFTNSDYNKLIRGFEPTAVAGNIPSVTSARLAYIMNFSGPCPLIDTACSSSMVALHMACQGIRAGDCDMALVGGVHLLLFPIKSYTMNHLGIESPDGRSRTFDAAASGVGAGEGVVAVVLKTLEKALKDRDQIYAVIKGSAVNNDGRSNGITAPNALAQTKVIKTAWERSGVDPQSISYIEAHGTGTKLGDPIEIEGLTGAFRAYTDKKRFCPIGSLKTNIGHLDSAAGVAGLLKTVLALKYREIPPSLHFKTPNPFIDFATAPVYVNTGLTPWEVQSGPRRAGVSSFGLSGNNAHVIVEEAPEIKREPEIPGMEYLFTLSAKTPNSFWGLLQKYLNYCKTHTHERLSDICYTATVGRGQYTQRLALIVGSMEELISKLETIALAGERADWVKLQAAEKIYYSSMPVKAGIQPEAVKVEPGVNLHAIAEKFITGTDLDWRSYYQKRDVRRISLPTYAFDRKHLWVEYFPDGTGDTAYDKINRLGYRKVDVLGAEPGTGKNAAAAALEESSNHTEITEILIHIWSKVLGYDDLTPDADFFALGGNSLNAMQIIANIHKELNIRLHLQEFLLHPTIQEMAECLNTMEKNIYAYIPAQPLKEYYPVSSAQKRIFLLCQHEGVGSSYNLPGVMIITGNLDVERFTAVFRKLVERHESFRTAFEFRSGELVQHIQQSVPFSVEYEEAETADYSRTVNSFVRPFNLSAAPLLRAKLVKMTDGRHLFLYDMHHIISDGVSLTILLKEVSALYAGRELAPLRIQYKDVAVWQKENWENGSFAHIEEFWLNEFSGTLPVLNLSTDFPRSEVADFHGGVIAVSAEKELAQRLQALAVSSGATLYIALLAAVNVLLAKYANQADIIIGTPVAGRPHADLENIIGMFVNTLALRNYPAHDKRFADFLTEVKDKTLAAFDNQEYQFEILLDKLGITPAKNRNPLFDVMFVLQNFEKGVNLDLGEIQFTPYPGSAVPVKFDLTLSVWELLEELRFEFEYRTALFTANTIEKLGADLLSIIKQVVDNPTIQIGDIEIDSGLVILENTGDDDGDFNF